jgi:hypothetical protein
MDLISIQPHEAFHLSAWPGWKQTVTSLVAEKLVIESKHQTRPGLADLHLLVGSWKHMFMSNWNRDSQTTFERVSFLA